ncbi:MAG: ABC transporter permease [Pseudomonadota bacterium]
MKDTSMAPDMGQRRFGRVNWLGLQTLIEREVMRFLSVWTQTLMAPVATAVLFMTVFTVAFGDRADAMVGVPFTQFLAPGILMMVVIQQAFANTSSSLVIAKIQGNIVDTLMPPLSPSETLAGYVIGGVARGVTCALAVGIVVLPWAGIWPHSWLWMIWFVFAGSMILALLGVLGGIYAEKFDQMSLITNFVITPLSFLSGTFYSVEKLPGIFWTISHVNPFFFLIDGFRFGALGVSDTDPWIGFGVTLGLMIVLTLWAWRWLATGYKLKA